MFQLAKFHLSSSQLPSHRGPRDNWNAPIIGISVAKVPIAGVSIAEVQKVQLSRDRRANHVTIAESQLTESIRDELTARDEMS